MRSWPALRSGPGIYDWRLTIPTQQTGGQGRMEEFLSTDRQEKIPETPELGSALPIASMLPDEHLG